MCCRASRAWVHEVILVDGNSTDGTVAVARELWPSIRIVRQQGRGKGAALRSGFAAATGDIIVMLDADGSTDPAEIPIFVGALLAGADFVKGSRFLQGGGTSDMPLHRKLGNWGFAMGVRVLFGGIYSDLCYGYNAFWRRVLPHMELYGDGFEIETIMNVQALRSGLKVVEVPSFEAERVHGVGPSAHHPRWLARAEDDRSRAAAHAPAARAGRDDLGSAGARGLRARGGRADMRAQAGDISVVICAHTEERWEQLVCAVASLEARASSRARSWW